MHGICKLLRRWQTFLTCVEDFDFFSLKHCTKGQYLSFYSKLALDWNRMRRLNCILWRLQQTWEADRKAWGRQRDEASTSRLMGNWWFVVFTKPVWVWLTRTRTGSRQKTSRLTGLFSFLTLFFFSSRDLNLFRVELCHSASVYVRDQLCAAWVYYCISAPLPSLTSQTLTFSERIVRKDRQFGAQSFGLTWYSDLNV